MLHKKIFLAISLLISYFWIAGQVCDGNADTITSSSVIVDDNDWRDTKKITRSIGLETGEMSWVLLETELREPVFAFDPTDDETITCMTEYRGKLYIGSCTAPGLTDTGSIFTYDPESNNWKKVFQVNDQGIIRLEAYNGMLYVPGYDANDGGWDLGNIYIHDGATWVERRTVPRAVHTYSIAVYKGKIYLSADIFDQPSPGVSLSSGKVPVYGRVVSSSDNGLTWKQEYRGPTMGQDVGLLMVFRDQLVLNARGDLVIFDGKEWKFLNPERANFLYVLDYAVDKDFLLLGTPFGLCYYDGKRTWRSLIFDWGYIRGICKLGDYWIFNHYTLRDGFIYHGPTGTHNYPSLKYGSNRPQFWADITIIPHEVLMQDAVAGRDLVDIDRKQLWAESIKMFQIRDLPTSISKCLGRVYIGTHPEGRVLVLPVVKQGVLESAVYPAEPASYRIFWESTTPSGTSVKFQIRTATNREFLNNTGFAGPDGTSQTFFENPGEIFKLMSRGFIQYRAILTTDDPAKTPYLKRVTISKVE